VGHAICDLAQQSQSGIEVLGMDSRQLDITREKSVHASIDETRPTIVINAAAYTAVDQAEQEPAKAYAVNRDGAGYIAAACARYDIPMLHISTDYVFDGKKPTPYVETDPANPINVYGASKWEGEQAIRQTLDKHIILRTSWVFGVYGKNFVYSIIKLAGQREELRIVNDQHGCPTSAAAIATALLTLSDEIRNRGQESGEISWGTYHFTGTPPITWFEFSNEIVNTTRQRFDYLVKSILPIPTSEFPTPAARPHNSVLNCDKIRAEFAIAQEPWQTGLAQMLTHDAFDSHMVR
jgi:dTDP-4-dehydrorhamnose reductase